MSKLSISFYGRDLYDYKPDSWQPFSGLLDGHSLVAIGDSAADFYVAFEHSAKHYRLTQKSIPLSRRFLVMFEPRAVNPLQFTGKVQSGYRAVFSPSKLQAKKANCVSYGAGGLPPREFIDRDLEINLGLASRELGSTLIQQNKFSFVRRSGYSLRWDVIRAFDEQGLPLKLAGRNWDKPLSWWLIEQAYALLVALKSCEWPNLKNLRLRKKLRSVVWVGEIPDSVEFQRLGTFSLVIENDPDYVSEKLFNALRAGAVPIYFGPDLSQFDIPRTIAIEIQVPNATAFVAAVMETPPSVIAAIVEAGQEWLADETHSKRWETAEGHKRIVSLVAAAIRSDDYLGGFPLTPS